jgi:hypothetical protein
VRIKIVPVIVRALGKIEKGLDQITVAVRLSIRHRATDHTVEQFIHHL